MKQGPSAAEFYTAGIGSIFVVAIVVFGLIFLYEKVFKDDDENKRPLTQKQKT